MSLINHASKNGVKCHIINYFKKDDVPLVIAFV